MSLLVIVVVTLLFGFLVGYGQANQQLNRRLSQAASQAKKFSEKKACGIDPENPTLAGRKPSGRLRISS